MKCALGEHSDQVKKFPLERPTTNRLNSGLVDSLERKLRDLNEPFEFGTRSSTRGTFLVFI